MTTKNALAIILATFLFACSGSKSETVVEETPVLEHWERSPSFGIKWYRESDNMTCYYFTLTADEMVKYTCVQNGKVMTLIQYDREADYAMTNEQALLKTAYTDRVYFHSEGRPVIEAILPTNRP